MYENIVGGIVSGIVLWILQGLLREEGFTSAKVILRVILSTVIGFFIGGVMSAIIESYTHKEIAIKSFEAFGLILVGILIAWYVFSSFSWLKSTH